MHIIMYGKDLTQDWKRRGIRHTVSTTYTCFDAGFAGVQIKLSLEFSQDHTRVVRNRAIK